MSLDASLPIVLAQMGHVEKIAHNETTTPEAQREAAKHSAAEALKHEQSAVERPQEAEGSTVLLDKDGGGGGGKRRQKKHPKKEQDAGEQEAEARNTSPWQGNILNLKV